MEKKRIGVTGIGGNVGQGILRILREVYPQFYIIGFNVNAFSAGNYLCNKVIEVPYAYDKRYIPVIKDIINKEQIDLLIPSTDYEVYYLSKFKDELNTIILCSGFYSVDVYTDKYKSYLHHKQHNIPFAEAFLPDEYDNSFEQIIVKPREGRGSRNVYINPKATSQFNDDYIVQEYKKGIEITTAAYVTKQRELLGFITFDRKLANGTTIECKVVTKYDNSLRVILQKIVDNSDIMGSFNLQAIVTQDGKIVPFEINCRISGTNSIRHNLGFQDVKYGIEEWLFNNKLPQPKITKGVACRILLDVIYPNASETEEFNANSNFKLF